MKRACHAKAGAAHEEPDRGQRVCDLAGEAGGVVTFDAGENAEPNRVQ
jgi:hypothetical protein